MPRPHRELTRWELDLQERCRGFVAEIAPGLTADVQQHIAHRVYVGMHRTLRNMVQLPPGVALGREPAARPAAE